MRRATVRPALRLLAPVTHALAGALLVAATWGSALQAQAMRLTVRDSLSGEGVGDAIVTVFNRSGDIVVSGRTRSSTPLTLTVGRPGSYTVFVRKLGFAPKLTESFEVAGELTDKDVVVRRIPQFLPEVAIRSEKTTIRNGTFFGMKVATLGAAIVSPTEVDRAVMGSNDLIDLISRNPSAGNEVDYGRKCILSTRGYPHTCLPVIVDGMLMSNSGDAIPPEIVDYIIIVRGNELGVMYGSVSELGAVMVFTKRGPKRGPGGGRE